MEWWSILSTVINHVQYNWDPIDYKYATKALDPKNNKGIYGKLEEDDMQVTDLDFGDNSTKIKRRIFRCIWRS